MLRILHNSFHCQLTQNSTDSDIIGGWEEEEINFSPFLASISLVFHHPQSAGGQAVQAAGGGSYSFLLYLPYSFSPHLALPALLRTRSGPTDMSLVMSLSRCLLLLARGSCSSPSTGGPGSGGCLLTPSMGHPAASLKPRNSHPKSH